MSNRIFYSVDLAAWIYGTIKKHRDGASWRSAWVDTYWAIGGLSKTSGEKGCPMTAAKTLYEMGRIRNSGLPFTDCRLPELWNGSKNGTYAILVTIAARESAAKQGLSMDRDSTHSETGDRCRAGSHQSGRPYSGLPAVAPRTNRRGGICMKPACKQTVWIGKRSNPGYLNEDEVACCEPIHARTPAPTGPYDVL